MCTYEFEFIHLIDREIPLKIVILWNREILHLHIFPIAIYCDLQDHNSHINI